MEGRPPPEDPASMTHHDEDPRVISPESELYNARLVRRGDQTSDLATVWGRHEGKPGPFPPRLGRLPVGHEMRMIGPKGRFLLEPDDDRTHLFVSTGTGIAPFISMIRQLMAAGKPRRTVVLHGASYADELGYRDLLEGWQRDRPHPVTSGAPGPPPRAPPTPATRAGPAGPAAPRRSCRRSAGTWA